jgi:hypothetical protein
MSILGDLGTKIGTKFKSLTDRVEVLEEAPVSSNIVTKNQTNIIVTRGEYQRLFRSTDGSLSSTLRVTLTGTTGNVVVGVIADLIVGHSGDIHINTQSNAYTPVEIKIVSTVNEDFDFYIKYVSGNDNLSLDVEVFSLSGGTIVFNPTDIAYTGTTLIHDTGVNSVKYSQASGNVNVYTDGNYYADGNKVLTENSHMGQLFANTSTNTETIMKRDNGGNIEPIMKNRSGVTDWYSISGDKVTITKSGTVFLTYNQDIITNGTSGYVYTIVYVNGTAISYQLISNTNNYWDGIHNSWSGYLNTGDYIQINYRCASGNITAWNHNVWSNYSFLWFK